MTAKETLWSVILIVVFIGSVYFGNVAIDKSDEFKYAYYETVDVSKSLDYKINQFSNYEQILQDKINGASRAAENFKRELLARDQTLTHEAYLAYKRKSGSAMSYETYRAPIEIGISVQTREYRNRLAKIKQMELELQEHRQLKKVSVPLLENELNQHKVQNSKQLKTGYNPEKNPYYYVMLACGMIMAASFMILMTICAPFRYVVYSVAAVATVSHLTKKGRQ